MLKHLLFGSLLLFFASSVYAAELTGTVSWIYDGDTLEIAGIGKVRLLGIDTPEGKDSERDSFYTKQFGFSNQQLRRISRQAETFTRKMTKGVQVRLVTEAVERDKHGRLLAYLYLPDGRLLNRSLLENGLATVFRRYQFRLKDDFSAAETAARKTKVGLWQH